MDVPTAIAIADYLELCHLSAESGLISLHEWRERLRFLQEMVKPGDSFHGPIGILEAEVVRAAEEVEPPVSLDPSFAPQSCDAAPDDGMLHFDPPSNTGLADYRFRVGDPDDEPSIPHGHYKDQKYPKLDAYRGGVFDRNKVRIRKEPPKRMIALWNDQKFRDFALKAIKQYQTSYPKHRWRVSNPQRLPRRRRP